MKLERLDHLVLTVRSIEATCNFYGRVLGMRRIVYQNGRTALAFGQQKINLHQVGTAVEPRSATPTPGSADLCFITNEDVSGIVAHLESCGARIVDGPVERMGAAGSMLSVYVRDPDGNLIEISHYEADARR